MYHINATTISDGFLHDMVCELPILDDLIDNEKTFLSFLSEDGVAAASQVAAPRPLCIIGQGEYATVVTEDDVRYW